jgi:hypothetical protein
MKKYTTQRTRAWEHVWDYYDQKHWAATGITVIEREPHHRATGILNKDGHELYAVEAINSIGFMRFKDK